MIRRAKAKLKSDNERAARRAFLDDLFYDVGRSQAHIYRINFLRGVFFGLGSVLGGTVVIAVVVWLLTVTGALIPGLQDIAEGISHTLQDK